MLGGCEKFRYLQYAGLRYMKNRGSQKPLVSVIIPTFNRAHIISRSVDSVLAQTFTDYEIIVVDDGSTDSTGEFLKNHYRDRIQYIAQSANRGLATARNRGIEESRGTYIAILDDDDLWLPEKLALQVELLQNNPKVALAYCGTVKVNCRGELLEEVKPETRGHIFKEMLNQNCLKGPASVAMFPSAVLNSSGMFDTRLSSCADWDLWVRIARCGQVDFVDRPLVKYVIHESNMHGNISGMARDTFAILDKYLPMLDQDYGCAPRVNRIYSNHLIHFAWEYYKQNDLEEFGKLLYQALERDPANHIAIHGDGLREKEKAVIALLRDYWSNAGLERGGQVRDTALSDHYIQLAWEYYHRGGMYDFRRCVFMACRHGFPHVPLRLAIPFFKSFMGKGIAESIHRACKRVRPAGH